MTTATMEGERTREWLGLVGWLAVVAVAAVFGSQFTPGSWYDELTKPEWTPPGRVFGPVWTVLYVAMAVAAWLVWQRRDFDGARLALGLFLVQLVLNALWSALFFGMESPGAGLVDIALLWITLLATVVLFFRMHLVAGFLLVPYLAWVSFAAALNLSIWMLNP
ncbi:MAG: TspO/MBR family protein [Gemmatimonadota bacterium]